MDISSVGQGPRKAQLVLAFQRLACNQGSTFNLDLPPGMPAEYVPEPEFLYTGSPERVSTVQLSGGSLTWQNEKKLRTRKSPWPLS
jgi:hypothetical protein